MYLLIRSSKKNQFIEDASAKMKQGLTVLKTHKKVQYIVLSGYLLIWLLSSGSLIKTIWIACGVALGWLVGRSQKDGE